MVFIEGDSNNQIHADDSQLDTVLLQQSLNEIRPEVLAPFRAFSSPSAFLPMMLLAANAHNLVPMNDIVHGANERQRVADGTIGWEVVQTTPRDVSRRGRRLGIISQLQTSNGQEDGPVAAAQISSDQADLVYATGGQLAQMLQRLWESGQAISSQEIFGKPEFSAAPEDTVWMRVRLYKILTEGFKAQGESFHLTVEQAAKLIGVQMDRLRPHLAILNEAGLLDYTVRERGTYVFLQDGDPQEFKSMQGVGSNELREIYAVVRSLLEDSDVTAPVTFSVKEVREKLGILNPDSTILRKQGPTDGVPAALSELRNLGILGNIDTTAIQLTREQFEQLIPIVQMVDGIIQRDETFIQDGKGSADRLLNDPMSLNAFMQGEKNSSVPRRAESRGAQQGRVIQLLLQQGAMPTTEIIRAMGKSSGEVRGALLRPLRRLGILHSQDIPGSIGGELLWDIAGLSRIIRVLREGGIIVFDRKSRLSEEVSQAQIVAIGQNMMRYVEALPTSSIKHAFEESLYESPSPISYLRFGVTASGEDRAALIVHPDKLALTTDSKENPTLVRSRGVENLKWLQLALVKDIRRRLQAAFPALEIADTDIQRRVVQVMATIATEAPNGK